VARPPRHFTEGIYHVACRASDDRFLFLSDANRSIFLDRLASTFAKFDLGLVTYALLSTHYHLVVSLQDGRLSTALQQLHTWYSRRHNKPLGRSAHLFRAHFFSRHIESDEDLLTVCRYVARNPVEAGFAAHPLAWRWSGARANAGLERATLDDGPLRDALGPTRDWRERYRDFIGRANAPQPG
jgi:REP element-mobilizing transposase RayT